MTIDVPTDEGDAQSDRTHGSSTDGVSSADARGDGRDASEPADDASHSVSVSVPDDATDEEVAAIAAAVQTHLQEERRRPEAQATEQRDPWTFSAQLLQAGHQHSGIPTDAPADNWVAAGRMS